MKNYWLEKRRLRLPSNDALTEAIVVVQRKEWDELYVLQAQQLTIMLARLANCLIDYSGPKIEAKLIDRDDAVQEIIGNVWEKLPRFDPAKGKAFNWVTTVMLGLLRQMVSFRHTKKYPELKRKYAEHLAGTKRPEEETA